MGHIEGHFRDLFPVQYSRKSFPENRYNVPEVPDGKRRTHGANSPAHLPAMNPDKALVGWMGRRGLADTGLDSGSAA